MLGTVHPNRLEAIEVNRPYLFCGGQSPLPPRLLIWDEDVRPIVFSTNQHRTDEVLTNVRELFGQTLVGRG
jgi:hypothetical protein